MRLEVGGQGEAVARVRERRRDEGEGILLVYDNAIDAESLTPYLPPGGGARVIVTSNAHVWRKIAAPVEIRVWPKETGADYLIARTGRDSERADAEALAETLGGLPLAHEQAAAYCERRDVSFAEYRRRFEAARAEEGARGFARPSLFVSHVAENRAATLRIVAELESREARCWAAPQDVYPGSGIPSFYD